MNTADMVEEVLRDAKEQQLKDDWNKVLLMGFYYHQDAKLRDAYMAFCFTRSIDLIDGEDKFLLPLRGYIPGSLTIRRFISGQIPRLAKVCYAHTSKDIAKIHKWMVGRMFKLEKDLKSDREAVERAANKKDYYHSQHSHAIRNEQWENLKSSNWNVCK